MARETIILTRKDIGSRIDIKAAIPAIEHAMGEFERGNDFLPPKAIYPLPIPGTNGGMAACITGYTRAADLLSMKVGQERADNLEWGLPTTNSWIAAFEPRTGELLMICDGTLPTMYRTGAAAAVSAKHLSRPDSATLAVIGAGQLGRQCLRAVSSVRPFSRIYLHDLRREAAEQVSRDLAGEAPAPIQVAEAEEACREADVIVTATTSRRPIVRSDWVRPGTHLCCMGSDLAEKIECEMELLPRCRLFADFVEHALLRGEASQAVEAGILGQDCYAGSLGQVINGEVAGRTGRDQITLYDGVGIGIQDTTIARTIFQQARDQDLGVHVAFS